MEMLVLFSLCLKQIQNLSASLVVEGSGTHLSIFFF